MKSSSFCSRRSRPGKAEVLRNGWSAASERQPCLAARLSDHSRSRCSRSDSPSSCACSRRQSFASGRTAMPMCWEARKGNRDGSCHGRNRRIYGRSLRQALPDELPELFASRCRRPLGKQPEYDDAQPAQRHPEGDGRRQHARQDRRGTDPICLSSARNRCRSSEPLTYLVYGVKDVHHLSNGTETTDHFVNEYRIRLIADRRSDVNPGRAVDCRIQRTADRRRTPRPDSECA